MWKTNKNNNRKGRSWRAHSKRTSNVRTNRRDGGYKKPKPAGLIYDVPERGLSAPEVRSAYLPRRVSISDVLGFSIKYTSYTHSSDLNITFDSTPILRVIKHRGDPLGRKVEGSPDKILDFVVYNTHEDSFEWYKPRPDERVEAYQSLKTEQDAINVVSNRARRAPDKKGRLFNPIHHTLATHSRWKGALTPLVSSVKKATESDFKRWNLLADEMLEELGTRIVTMSRFEIKPLNDRASPDQIHEHMCKTVQDWYDHPPCDISLSGFMKAILIYEKISYDEDGFAVHPDVLNPLDLCMHYIFGKGCGICKFGLIMESGKIHTHDEGVIFAKRAPSFHVSGSLNPDAFTTYRAYVVPVVSSLCDAHVESGFQYDELVMDKAKSLGVKHILREAYAPGNHPSWIAFNPDETQVFAVGGTTLTLNYPQVKFLSCVSKWVFYGLIQARGWTSWRGFTTLPAPRPLRSFLGYVRNSTHHGSILHGIEAFLRMIIYGSRIPDPHFKYLSAFFGSNYVDESQALEHLLGYIPTFVQHPDFERYHTTESCFYVDYDSSLHMSEDYIVPVDLDVDKVPKSKNLVSSVRCSLQW